MFFNKKSTILGNYVKYSHETAKENPRMILNEYTRMAYSIKDEIKALSGLGDDDFEFKLIGYDKKSLRIIRGLTDGFEPLFGTLSISGSSLKIKVYNDYIKGIAKKIENNLSRIKELRLKSIELEKEHNEFIERYL